VQASDPEGSALVTFRFCVATSSNPHVPQVKSSDADVRAASEIGWALSMCTRETIAKREAEQALLAIDRTGKNARVSISNLLRKDTRKH